MHDNLGPQPHVQAPLTNAERDHLREVLTATGCRFTRQREAVYHFLRSVDSHPTAEDVYLAVRQTIPNISLATVYKSLEALVDCRLALKLSFGQGPSRYDCRTDKHYHLHCIRTGQVRDVPLAQNENLLNLLPPELLLQLKEIGFEVTDYRFELLGQFTNAVS